MKKGLFSSRVCGQVSRFSVSVIYLYYQDVAVVSVMRCLLSTWIFVDSVCTLFATLDRWQPATGRGIE